MADRVTRFHLALAAGALVVTACTGDAVDTTTPPIATTSTTTSTTIGEVTTPTASPSADDLFVAFVWRYHEPIGTVDPGEIDPKVRLRAAHDYLDLADALTEVPGSLATIIASSTTLADLSRLADGESDAVLDLMSLPAVRMSTEQQAAVIDRFFEVPPGSTEMLPRLRELLDRRRNGLAFDAADIRDLQVLFGLAWLDVTHTPEAGPLIERGRSFDEIDQEIVTGALRSAPAAVLDGWADLAASGTVEAGALTYANAVIPLLSDSWIGSVSDPGGALPPNQLIEHTDVSAVVRRGIDAVDEALGVAPVGVLPGGGAVSGEALEWLPEDTVEWLITGETTLARSLGLRTLRADDGSPASPEDLYRPWALQGRPALFAADTELGRVIAEEYSALGTTPAASDFLRRLEAIRDSMDGPGIVTIVVDGALPHLADDGLLTEILRRIAETPGITTTTPSAYLATHAATVSDLDTLWPGSLETDELTAWAGDGEEADAWNLLWRVRLDLRLLSREGRVSDQHIFEAFEAIHFAESGDWFRWLGDDADSGDDRAVERRFREALGVMYDRMLEPREDIVAVPLIPARPEPAVAGAWTSDDASLAVRWVDAGLEIAFDPKPLTSGATFWLSAGDADGRRVSLNGRPLGFAAHTLLRWSTISPRIVDELTVPPFGSTEVERLEPIEADFAAGGVRMVVPIDRLADLESGDPVAIRVAPIDSAAEALALLPLGGPAIFPAYTTPILEVVDPTGDDHGPGRYSAPLDQRFTPGAFDIERFAVGEAGDDLVVSIDLEADLSNPFSAARGLSLQVIDIAIDIDPGTATGRRSFPDGRNVALDAEHGFEAVITIDDDGAHVAAVDANGDLSASTRAALRLDRHLGRVTVVIPRSLVGDGNPSDWGFSAVVSAADPGEPTGIRGIGPIAGQWTGGGAAPDASHPNIYDALWPEAGEQERLLGEYRPAESTGNLGPDDYATVPLITVG